jgi:uncharacterized protein
LDVRLVVSRREWMSERHVRAPGPGHQTHRRVAVACTTLALVMAMAGAALALTPLPRRDLGRSVYDPAGVIGDAHEAQMEAMHAELFRQTGVAIVTIAVPALVDETIADLAVRVGTEWGVGQKGQDRGIVVAFARDDREIYVATGYGVEGYLPDGKVGALLDEHVLPLLRRNDFSAGLYQASVALVAASAREFGVTVSGAEIPRPAPAREPSRGWTALEWVVRGIIGLVVLYLLIRHPRLLFAMFLSGVMRRGRGGGGGFGRGGGFGGFGGGGFGGGGAGRRF